VNILYFFCNAYLPTFLSTIVINGNYLFLSIWQPANYKALKLASDIRRWSNLSPLRLFLRAYNKHTMELTIGWLYPKLRFPLESGVFWVFIIYCVLWQSVCDSPGGSWLNMDEIELSVFVRQCLARRFLEQTYVEAESCGLGRMQKCWMLYDWLAIYDRWCPHKTEATLISWV